MRKISCSEISKDNNIFYIKKICSDRYMELKLDQDEIFELDKKPNKKYEIYKISLNIEKTMLCDTKYFSDSNEKEVYYNKNIALEIYDLMLQLESDVSNSFPELIEMYQEEIYNRQNRIQTLKNEDEKKYQEAIKVYEFVSNTEILQGIKEKYELNKQEIVYLQKKLDETHDIVINLAKKLEIALDKYKELKLEKSSWLKKIFKKLD